MTQITYPPFSVFFGLDGDPLDDGYVYVGEAHKDPERYPIATFWDVALTQPAPQPLRTISGYIDRDGTPANAYVAPTNYSVTVKDAAGSFVYTSLSEALISAGGADTDYIAGDGSIKDFGTAVRGTVLTGLNAALTGAITATDTVLSAFGKLQNQINAAQANLPAGTIAQYLRGDKTFQDLFTQVRAATLTGIVFTTGIPITSSDTVLSALGKLQAQQSKGSLAAGNISSNGTILGGRGITTVLWNSPGLYTVTFAPALSSIPNGICLITVENIGVSVTGVYHFTTTTVCEIRLFDNGTDPSPADRPFGFQILDLG